MSEIFEWKKWFIGMIDLTRWAKDFGTLIRLIGISVLVYLLVVGGVALWKRAMPKPKTPTVATVNQSGGTCEITGDKKTKWGLINLW